MQQQVKHDLARKNVALIVGIILTCLTVVSLVASYSIYMESFRDWPIGPRRFFAVLATLGVEIAFIVLVWGMERAYSGVEMPIAVAGAASLLGAMAINFTLHHAIASALPLSGWQDEWRNWVGLVIPFYTIALFVLLSFVSPESKERRQERKINFAGRERALQFRENYLQSPEFDLELESTKGHIAEEVRQHITKQLPAPSNEFPRSLPKP